MGTDLVGGWLGLRRSAGWLGWIVLILWLVGFDMRFFFPLFILTLGYTIHLKVSSLETFHNKTNGALFSSLFSFSSPSTLL